MSSVEINEPLRTEDARTVSVKVLRQLSRNKAHQHLKELVKAASREVLGNTEGLMHGLGDHDDVQVRVVMRGLKKGET